MKGIKKILHALKCDVIVTKILVYPDKYMTTVGRNKKVIEERIHNQIQDDIVVE